MTSQLDDPNADARHQLAVLARRLKKRIVPRDKKRPCRWFPTRVLDPATQQVFTQSGAWEMIVGKLDQGEKLWVINLDHPPGKVAYVMKFRLAEDQPLIYVKLELGSGSVYGRSFHYSEKQDRLGGE